MNARLLQVLRRLPIFSVVGTPGKILRDNDFIMFVGQRRKKEGGKILFSAKKENTERTFFPKTFIFLRELRRLRYFQLHLRLRSSDERDDGRLDRRADHCVLAALHMGRGVQPHSRATQT